MDFTYKTERLILKIEQPEAAPLVLDFYKRNEDFFARFEPERSNNFYNLDYLTDIMRYELKEALKLLGLRYYLYEQSTGNMVGTVHLGNIRTLPYFSCEVGYKLDEHAQHQGYAFEALSFLIDAINKDLNIHRYEAFVMPDNIPSLRLLERLGFEQEGYIKDYVYMHDRWQDHLLYTKRI